MSDSIQLPTDLETERDALVAEILAAFEHVSREGGVSWTEAMVIDDEGSSAERRAARRQDTDQNWIELLDDEQWHPLGGVGGFSFLDAAGFHYYLPAAMIHTIHHGARTGLDAGVLTLNKATKPDGFSQREWHLEKWSRLDDRQRRCVARFLRYLIASEEALVDDYVASDWRTAYERYWNTVDELNGMPEKSE